MQDNRAMLKRRIEFLAVFFVSFIVASVTTVFFTNMNQKEVGTVNLKTLINRFSVHEAQQKLSNAQIESDVNAFRQKLDDTLNQFAKRHHLILVAKETVLTNATDYTVAINNELEKS